MAFKIAGSRAARQTHAIYHLVQSEKQLQNIHFVILAPDRARGEGTDPLRSFRMLYIG
jgi:hypothetical protein